MNTEFFEALAVLEKERGIAGDYLLEKIKNAIVIAVKKDYEVEDDNVQVDIDPATGRPAESGLTSVTVVADGTVGNGTMCDALSTALFVMGEERALDLWRSGVYDFDLVLVTADGRLLVTDGIADRFQPDETAGYAYEVVS